MSAQTGNFRGHFADYFLQNRSRRLRMSIYPFQHLPNLNRRRLIKQTKNTRRAKIRKRSLKKCGQLYRSFFRQIIDDGINKIDLFGIKCLIIQHFRKAVLAALTSKPMMERMNFPKGCAP